MGDADLLAAWERGAARSAPVRALALLSAARPDDDDETLAAMPLGRRDRLLLSFRERLFGSAVVSLAACPACDETVELSFETAQVRAEAGDEVRELHTTADGDDVRFRLPTTADLLAAADADDVESAARTLLERCVLSAGSRAPVDVGAAVAAAMAEADPQADVALGVDCPACGNRWSVPFDIAAFLWDEVEVWAARTLHEVHTLASAYGWTEIEVLALGAFRRRAYLDLVAG